MFGDLAGRDSRTNLQEGFLLFHLPCGCEACLESAVAFEKQWMIPEIPFNRALTLFYLQNVTPVGQDLLQIRSYVYAEEPNIDIHNFVGTFTRVSEPRGAQGPAWGATGARARYPLPAGLCRGIALWRRVLPGGVTGVRARCPAPAGLCWGVALCHVGVTSPSEDSALKTDILASQ